MVGSNPRQPFDPEGFIAKVGEGRNTKSWARHETVFAEGDAAWTQEAAPGTAPSVHDWRIRDDESALQAT